MGFFLSFCYDFLLLLFVDRGDITKSSPEIFFRKLRFTDEGAAPVFVRPVHLFEVLYQRKGADIYFICIDSILFNLGWMFPHVVF